MVHKKSIFAMARMNWDCFLHISTSKAVAGVAKQRAG